MPARVIVVEDEELISTMIRVNLEREGYSVESFYDAESMLEYFGADTSLCDIFLLDVMLPGMTGEDAIAKIRELGFNGPVLMLTARRDIETRVSVLNRGADDYMPKPFNVDELLARVNALLRRNRRTGGESED